jgi:predicted Zn-dependent protease
MTALCGRSSRFKGTRFEVAPLAVSSKNSKFDTMAQPASNPKIEELRFKVRTDPKSRLFYPLAEELRKVGRFGEAEEFLRAGLGNHPTYLSGWVSLGRVLRDQKKDRDASEALAKALQLDPGNIVAARLLADSYLALGEKVEAIKKYKLVHALLPSDQEVEALIAQLERELNPIAPSPFAMADEVAAAPRPTPPPPPPAAPPTPIAPPVPEPPAWNETERVFDDTASSLLRAQMQEKRTGDSELTSAQSSESPFDEPAAGFGHGSEALAVEHPHGIHITRPQLTADVPEPWGEPLPPETAPAIAPEPPLEAPPDAADVFAPAESAAAATPEDVTNTLTMADLYVRQGLHDEARRIYDSILEREPQNVAVRSKRDALPGGAAASGQQGDPKVEKLQRWLRKVARKEAGGV